MRNDIGRDEDDSGQKDIREWHVVVVANDAGEAPDEDSKDATSNSHFETEGEVGVWSPSGVNSEAYKRRMVVQKKEIIGKRQKFVSIDP